MGCDLVRGHALCMARLHGGSPPSPRLVPSPHSDDAPPPPSLTPLPPQAHAMQHYYDVPSPSPKESEACKVSAAAAAAALTLAARDPLSSCPRSQQPPALPIDPHTGHTVCQGCAEYEIATGMVSRFHTPVPPPPSLSSSHIITRGELADNHRSCSHTT